MSRYIDVDKIVYTCRVDDMNCNYECDTCYYRSVSKNEIENMITEDVVSVVHCKDCFYWTNDKKENKRYCHRVDDFIDENFYCGFAERVE